MFTGRYLCDFATHIDFRVNDRTLRTQAINSLFFQVPLTDSSKMVFL